MSQDKKEKEWTDEEWTTKTAELRVWVKTNNKVEEHEDTIMAIKMNLKRGDNKASSRNKAWASCLLEMRNVENSPIGGKGAASTLPKPVQESLQTIRENLLKERQLAFGEYTSLVMMRRTSTGKDENKVTTKWFYRDALEEATSWVNGRIAMLKTAFKEDEWDGSIEGLDNMATHIKPTVAVEDDSNDTV